MLVANMFEDTEKYIVELTEDTEDYHRYASTNVHNLCKVIEHLYTLYFLHNLAIYFIIRKISCKGIHEQNIHSTYTVLSIKC